MEETGGGLQIKDIVTMALSGVSLGVTIVWNLLNRRHTDSVAAKIRSEAYDQEGWKSDRTEIERAVRALENAASDLTILARAGHDKAELLEEMAKQNLLLAQKHMALIRELERGDFQPCWGPLAYGSEIDGESDWDRLNTVLADASSMDDPNAIRAELAKIDPHVRAIAGKINRVIRERSMELHPGKGKI